MAVVAAVVSFDNAATAGAMAKQLAERSNRYPSLNVEPLVTDGILAAYHLMPGAAQRRGRLIVSRPDAFTVLVGGPARSHQAGEIVARELALPGSATAALPYGRWLAVRHDAQARTVRVLNDPLGMAWLYVARVPNGFLLSSDLAALVASYPQTLTVNYDALLAQLALGYVPSDATCLNEVSMLPPGSVVELSERGSAVLSVCRPPYGDRHAGLSQETKFDMIDGLLAHALGEWCHGDYSDIVVSLSGGNDSPFALAGLLSLGVKPNAMTWGHPRSRDVRVPRALARKLGFEWTWVESPTPSWASWMRTLQGVGAGGSDWAGWGDDWLNRLATRASGAVTGSAGEALTGKNVRQPDEGPAGDWTRKWLTRGYQNRWADSPLLRPDARRRLPQATRDHLDAQTAGIEVAFSHQRALHIDLYGRQRRLTGGQTNEMARVLAPLTFFNTREMVDFWTNISWRDFDRQALYLEYARSRHSDVFDVVLGARDADASLLGAPRRVTRAARLRVAGLLPGMRERLATTSNDLLGNQLRFRAEIAQMIDAVAPLLDPVLDVAAIQTELQRFPRSRLVTPFRLANLLSVSAQLALIFGRANGRA